MLHVGPFFCVASFQGALHQNNIDHLAISALCMFMQRYANCSHKSPTYGLLTLHEAPLYRSHIPFQTQKPVYIITPLAYQAIGRTHK